jgi:hypothetical protein
MRNVIVQSHVLASSRTAKATLSIVEDGGRTAPARASDLSYADALSTVHVQHAHEAENRDKVVGVNEPGADRLCVFGSNRRHELAPRMCERGSGYLLVQDGPQGRHVAIAANWTLRTRRGVASC